MIAASIAMVVIGVLAAAGAFLLIAGVVVVAFALTPFEHFLLMHTWIMVMVLLFTIWAKR